MSTGKKWSPTTPTRAPRRTLAQSLSPGVYPIEIAYYQGGGGMGFLVQSNLSSPGSTTLSTLLNSQVTTGVLSASQFFNTPINVAADATVNVSGSLAATVGSLAIGAQTLTVASSDTSGSAYSLTAGAVTLSGNATFNVANSTGGGAGTLTLGPITGTSNVTVLGPGVVSLPYDSSGCSAVATRARRSSAAAWRREVARWWPEIPARWEPVK